MYKGDDDREVFLMFVARVRRCETTLVLFEGNDLKRRLSDSVCDCCATKNEQRVKTCDLLLFFTSKMYGLRLSHFR